MISGQKYKDYVCLTADRKGWKTMKKILLSVILFSLILFMAGAAKAIAPYYASDNRETDKISLSREVDSEQYKEDLCITTHKLEIREDGRYVIEAAWNCDTNMVTGFLLLSPEGENMASCTGNCVDMYTNPIEMAAGSYDMIFYYMTKQADLDAFAKRAKTEMNFTIEEVSGTSIVTGDYSVYLTAPVKEWEALYLVSMIAGLMGSVLAGFELILEFTKRKRHFKAQQKRKPEKSGK